MGWLQCLLLLYCVTMELSQVLCEEAEELVNRYLEQETSEMLAQRAEEMASPPLLNIHHNFMRSFVPNTGVGNREELSITGLRELPVFHDMDAGRFMVHRFNSSDYVLISSHGSALLKKLQPVLHDTFVLSSDDAILTFTPPHDGTIVDMTMYTRIVKRSMFLYVAILTRSQQSSLVHIFEVVGDRGIPIGVIDIGTNPEAKSPSVKKIAFVTSQHGGSLVVLIDSPGQAPQIIYQNQGSSDVNHYIAVLFPSGLDLVSFMVQGHGYIAVANKTSCHVFKLDEFAKRHWIFDRLIFPQGDVTDLEYFRLGFHHYLAISGTEAQYLYVWKRGEFAFKQMFNSKGVKQLFSAVIPTCRDDVILFLIKEGNVQIFVYEGSSGEFVPASVDIPDNFDVVPGSVTSFVLTNRAVLFFMNTAGGMSAFLVDTRLTPAPHPVKKIAQDMNDYLLKLQDTLKKQAEQIENIKEVLKNAVRTTGDQYIEAFQVFKTLHSNEGALVKEIEHPIFIEWEDSSLTLEQYKQGTKRLEQEIQELEELVKKVDAAIKDVVRTDETTVITGSKRFTGDISGSSLVATSVNLQEVDGINIPELQKNVYRMDKPQKIKGTLTFEKPLIVSGNLDVKTTINGIDFSEEVMTTNTEQTSDAMMFFENKLTVTGDLEVKGRINDIDISEEVVTLHGDHVITGRKKFLNGIIAQHVSAQLLDGVDIDRLYENALTKSGDQHITGTKTFDGGLVTSDIELRGYLNGVNVTAMADSIVRVDQPAFIYGHKTFTENVIIQGPLTVQGTVNGLRIPDDLFLTDIAQTITGNKEFLGTVSAHNVLVKGTVDGVDIPEDLVTLSGDEEIPGDVHFADGINVENDIIVEGLVDGVDISEVVKDALKVNETHQFQHGVFYGPVTIAGDLKVGGTVNNVKLDEMMRDIVFKDEKDVVVTSKKQFKKVTADVVRLEHALNGFNIHNDFMKVDGDQEIKGKKIFKEPVVFTALKVRDGMVGGLNITQLHENRLTLLIEDNIEEDVEFVNEVTVEGELIVHGRIGGLDFTKDIVRKNSNQPISNKVFAGKVTVDNLVVNGDAQVKGNFGGLDLNKFYNDRISLSRDEVIDGDIWIGNSVIENVEVSGLVNGVDIKEFASNIMSKSKEQTVTAPMHFTGQTTITAPITTEGVNGINLKVLNDRAFKLNSDNYVTEPLGFQDISVQDMSVVGFVNGVNLTHLAEDSLKKYGLQQVKGVTVFESGFHVDGDILAQKVNDLVIPEDVLLKSSPQTISGQYTIKNLIVNGDLEVKGLVNGLDLSEVKPRLAKVDEEHIIESNVTFIEPVHISEGIQVSGLVNGVDLKRLSESVLLKDGDQVIRGKKILRGKVTVKGNVDVDNVNGVDWKAFLTDVVRIDIPQNVRSPKYFADEVEIGSLQTATADIEYLNGRQLKEIFADAVFIDIPANITGTKTFKKAVQITGDLNADLINGLNLKTDVITLMCNDDILGPQIITGEKTFGNVTVYADIHVGGLVNSYNLFSLYKDTLLTEGDQTITGRKTLINEVTFKGDVMAPTVNGLNLQNDLVTLDTDQEIMGPLEFNVNVYIEKDLHISGLLNGVNVSELAKEAVYLDTNDTIGGAYSFDRMITANDLTVTSGLVNGINIVEFDRNISDFWREAEDQLFAMDAHLQDNCEMINHLQDQLSKSYYTLDSFAVYQDLGNPAAYIHARTPESIALVSVGDASAETAPAVRAKWNREKLGFEPIGYQQRTKYAKTEAYTVGSSEISINSGIRHQDSHVAVNGLMLNVTQGFKAASLHVKDSNKLYLALLLPNSGDCEVYEINPPTTGVVSLGSAAVGKSASSVVLFDIGKVLTLAVPSFSSSPYDRGFFKVYQRVNDIWQRSQSIPISASSYVTHFVYHGYHYLIFPNLAPVHETKQLHSIQVYRNSGPNPQLFTFFQKFDFSNSKGVEIFRYGVLSDLHLVTWNDSSIGVYRLEGESGFQPLVSIPGRCINEVRALLIDQEIYLLAARQNLKSDEPITSVLYKGITKGTKYMPQKLNHC